jgi:protocatechuate 3,4-dioxygenase alpha subunit
MMARMSTADERTRTRDTAREPAAGRLVATPSQTVGPFFHFGLVENTLLGRLAGEDAKGTRIRLQVRVLDGDAAPVPDALIEIWQADADGRYVRPADPTTTLSRPTGFCGFGRLPTAADGSCVFETIVPGRVRDPAGVEQAAHVNVCLFARGLLRQLYTRIYFEGGDGLDTDPMLNLVPASRRNTLMARSERDGEWQFDVVLQGEAETVFFDL